MTTNGSPERLLTVVRITAVALTLATLCLSTISLVFALKQKSSSCVPKNDVATKLATSAPQYTIDPQINDTGVLVTDGHGIYVVAWEPSACVTDYLDLGPECTGVTGPRGYNGTAGPPGEQGPPGPQGPPGARGDDSTQGPAGDDGDEGDPGDQGTPNAVTGRAGISVSPLDAVADAWPDDRSGCGLVDGPVINYKGASHGDVAMFDSALGTYRWLPRSAVEDAAEPSTGPVCHVSGFVALNAFVVGLPESRQTLTFSGPYPEPWKSPSYVASFRITPELAPLIAARTNGPLYARFKINGNYVGDVINVVASTDVNAIYRFDLSMRAGDYVDITTSARLIKLGIHFGIYVNMSSGVSDVALDLWFNQQDQLLSKVDVEQRVCDSSPFPGPCSPVFGSPSSLSVSSSAACTGPIYRFDAWDGLNPNRVAGDHYFGFEFWHAHEGISTPRAIGFAVCPYASSMSTECIHSGTVIDIDSVQNSRTAWTLYRVVYRFTHSTVLAYTVTATAGSAAGEPLAGASPVVVVSGAYDNIYRVSSNIAVLMTLQGGTCGNWGDSAQFSLVRSIQCQV